MKKKYQAPSLYCVKVQPTHVIAFSVTITGQANIENGGYDYNGLNAETKGYRYVSKWEEW